MSNLLNQYYKVLDDGFVSLKGFMGTDEEIEQAARVSYGKGTRKVSDTRNLIRYLMRHHHTTPTEMGELKFHIRAPIYVIRQWHRHRTWSYNEYSGRYSEMIDSCQKTEEGEWRGQSKTNKQGSDNSGVDWPENADMDEIYAPHMDNLSAQKFLSVRDEAELIRSRHLYEERLKFGVAKEQARKNLPVSNYTEMYAKVDLKNLLGFFRLRCDSHAQLEIRQFANVMASITKSLFPLSFEAWYDYHFMSAGFTRLDRMLLSFYMHFLERCEHGSVTNESIEDRAKLIGMSSREITEFWEKLNLPEEIDFSLDNLTLLDMKAE